jgi:hypothetical protein
MAASRAPHLVQGCGQRGIDIVRGHETYSKQFQVVGNARK